VRVQLGNRAADRAASEEVYRLVRSRL
jgi:hypothetical protein